MAALVAATLTTGLVAGLFYAYTCSVMPGLRRAGDRTFVETMQRINVAILNGWFLSCFLGAAVLTALALALHIAADVPRPVAWLVAALVLYVAQLAVTFSVNVPLNNELEAAGAPDRVADPSVPADARRRFEGRWVRWNLVRTLTSTAAFACLLGALVSG
ncbi:hypothetical protein Sme01_49370 [Sphaerisporangium melleum]|uniref:DUF1772 domain-containing protein n=1 Tax=Sphaerisporangium melleum TaxID=321316 RepID=A0A917R4X0_9ACTN|nr:hypothetical protein GCM10007964_34750 [Sphaerisporangium melleum]GII72461.1 hypothetical protein Sme01_49370 [Sphaerisporangium melleum]